MKLLLDTHAFLWFLAGDPRVGPARRRRIEDPANDKFLSIASVWEMAIKISLGKLAIQGQLADLVDEAVAGGGIALLGISREHAVRVAALPWHHRDPFDRMIAVQAIANGLTLMARDAAFDAYGVDRVW